MFEDIQRPNLQVQRYEFYLKYTSFFYWKKSPESDFFQGSFMMYSTSFLLKKMLFKSHFVFVLKIHISFLQATTFRFADYILIEHLVCPRVRKVLKRDELETAPCNML